MEKLIGKEIFYAETGDTTAVNILTQIDRVSKHVPGFREEYDLLSERTHPNGLGALCHFWGLGKDVIRFSDGADQENAVNCLLRAVGRLLGLMHKAETSENARCGHGPREEPVGRATQFYLG
jgi:hypothetical protein